jgi:hypothetical protein
LIWDSYPWKDALLKDAAVLDSYLLEDEMAQVDFERTIFVAAFTLRKLLEAKTLTDRVANCDVKCRKFPLIDPVSIPNHMNWHQVDRFYDFDTSRKATVKLAFFTNQLIHSFVFAPIVNAEEDQRAAGFYVATDFDRSKFLYEYELSEMVRIMRLVGNDAVLLSRSERGDKGDWIIHNYGVDDPETKARKVQCLDIEKVIQPHETASSRIPL